MRILPTGSERELAFEELATNEGFFDHESISTITGVLEGESAERISAQSYVVDGKESKV